MRSRRARVVRMRSTYGWTFSIRERGEWWTDARGARRAWSTRGAAEAALAAGRDTEPDPPTGPKPAAKAEIGSERGGPIAKPQVRPSSRSSKRPVPSSPDSLKDRVRAFLSERPDATNQDVIDAFAELRKPIDVVRLLHGA